jgi:3-dehydroquinate synthase
VPVVQLPTSLLAMVDSAVGGKTGVNTSHGKNLVGAFHPPALVLADTAALATLDRRHLRAGLAECVKHACIADAEHFRWLEREAERLVDAAPERYTPLVERSVRIKAEVVGRDEREGGARKILNFGHTIGHAEEHATGYRRLHGEAIAVGLVAEARLGESLGVTAAGTAGRIAALLERIGLPTEPNASIDSLIRATGADKKARAGRAEYVLLEDIGRVARPDGEWTVPVEERVVREVVGGR